MEGKGILDGANVYLHCGASSTGILRALVLKSDGAVVSDFRQASHHLVLDVRQPHVLELLSKRSNCNLGEPFISPFTLEPFKYLKSPLCGFSFSTRHVDEGINKRILEMGGRVDIGLNGETHVLTLFDGDAQVKTLTSGLGVRGLYGFGFHHAPLLNVTFIKEMFKVFKRGKKGDGSVFPDVKKHLINREVPLPLFTEILEPSGFSTWVEAAAWDSLSDFLKFRFKFIGMRRVARLEEGQLLVVGSHSTLDPNRMLASQQLVSLECLEMYIRHGVHSSCPPSHRPFLSSPASGPEGSQAHHGLLSIQKLISLVSTGLVSFSLSAADSLVQRSDCLVITWNGVEQFQPPSMIAQLMSKISLNYVIGNDAKDNEFYISSSSPDGEVCVVGIWYSGECKMEIYHVELLKVLQFRSSPVIPLMDSPWIGLFTGDEEASLGTELQTALSLTSELSIVMGQWSSGGPPPLLTISSCPRQGVLQLAAQWEPGRNRSRLVDLFSLPVAVRNEKRRYESWLKSKHSIVLPWHCSGCLVAGIDYVAVKTAHFRELLQGVCSGTGCESSIYDPDLKHVHIQDPRGGARRPA